MGALDTLQDFVQTKVTKVVNKVTGRGSQNSATPGKGDTTHGTLPGFPFVNYASERISVRPMIIPRVKYTYGVQFNINPDALLNGVAITNIPRFITDGYLYTQLKRIDHPKPAFAVETLRSYNKYVKLPTKMEFPPASMTFDDDATSITTALMKEYINFYSHSGDVGSQLITAGNTSNAGPVPPPNFNKGFADNAFSNDQPNVGYNHLVANAETPDPRANMNTRPSMGMRLKPNYKRHFFDSIVIYDLGVDPNSVNIYYFYKPVITTIDHAGLDTEDRTSKVEITMNFEYENYYFIIGRNRLEVADAIESLTGVRPSEEITNDFFPNTHGAMEDVPTSGSLPVSKVSPNPQTPMPDVDAPVTTTPAPQPVTPSGRPPGEIEAEIEEARIQLTGIAARTSSTGGDDPEVEFEKERLTNKIKLLTEELNASTTTVAAVQKREQAAPATQSAVDNIKKQAAVETPETPPERIQNDENLIVGGKTKDQWRETYFTSIDMENNLKAEADALEEESNEVAKNGGSIDKQIELTQEVVRLRTEALEQRELQKLALDSANKIRIAEERDNKPI